jgi:hypothetical protein
MHVALGSVFSTKKKKKKNEPSELLVVSSLRQGRLREEKMGQGSQTVLFWDV